MFMNIQEQDILKTLFTEPFVNQRILSEISGHSLGIVNRSLASLMKDGYLDKDMKPTEKAKTECETSSPKNAVILAAGYGMRMVPVNLETPKGLIEVNKEPLIERLIRQLHEVGITEIYIIVGFLKERYEYLIDEFGVELIVNPDYAKKNNLHSLNLVRDKLANTYIMPCDIWCDINPFSQIELYSWYMVSDLVDDDSEVRVNRKMELVTVSGGNGGNAMIGISYLLARDCQHLKQQMEKLCQVRNYDHAFWETILYQEGKMIIPARVVHAANVIEINTYEQLRDLDEASLQLKSGVIDIIADLFHVPAAEISDITLLKKGMTNRSFIFSCKGSNYIMRVPGEGTDKLINRRQEAQVYDTIAGKGLCDDPIYLNPDNGYKITRFLNGVRVCNVDDISDLNVCMKKLRDFHNLNLKVDHVFDIFKQIDFYESLWNGQESIYRDYSTTKQNVLSLREYIQKHASPYCLTHIDAVPDNFLFYTDSAGNESLQLTDWEYSGMQDPHVDIAMFCIYSGYQKKQVDRLINLYFENNCPDMVRVKIYCYIAACGLLWSNWCEYKRNLGVEFGEYSLRQYRYAKEYYRHVRKEMDGNHELCR